MGTSLIAALCIFASPLLWSLEYTHSSGFNPISLTFCYGRLLSIISLVVGMSILFYK